MPIITVSDETTTGPKTPAWALEIFEETVRLDELIRRRIFQEVAESGSGADAEERTRVTLGAYGRNAFVVLVDDRQVTELDEVVHLHAGTKVTFLKLVPLVGG